MQNITLLSLFLIGLSYGATACMLSCMPFITPLLVGSSKSTRESLALMLPFSLGRIFSYTSLAMLSLAGASFVKAILGDKGDFEALLGGLTLLMGLFMLYTTQNREKKSCSPYKNPTLLERLSKSRVGLFGIGILISINPCSALMSLLALSANSLSFLDAASMGIAFGLGAVLVPFLFYGFFLSTLIRGILVEFKSYTKIIEIVASLLLMSVGAILLSTHITL